MTGKSSLVVAWTGDAANAWNEHLRSSDPHATHGWRKVVGQHALGGPLRLRVQSVEDTLENRGLYRVFVSRLIS